MSTSTNTFLLAQDTLNGKQGFATTVQNGIVRSLFEAEKITFEANIETSKVKVIGSLVTQTKNTGVEFTGTINKFYGTDYFAAMLRTFLTTGVMPYFDLNITNNDPASSAGIQSVTIQNCLITSKITLAMLDDGADTMKDDISYSATGMIVNSTFSDPVVFGVTQTTPAGIPMTYPQ